MFNLLKIKHEGLHRVSILVSVIMSLIYPGFLGHRRFLDEVIDFWAHEVFYENNTIIYLLAGGISLFVFFSSYIFIKLMLTLYNWLMDGFRN